MAAGDQDNIFPNLPGSPKRPKPPPGRGLMQDMFPVDPRQALVAADPYLRRFNANIYQGMTHPFSAVSNAMDLGTNLAGQFVTDVARQPFPGLAPNFSLPDPEGLGRDITAKLQMPNTEGGLGPMAKKVVEGGVAAAPFAVTARGVAPEAKAAARTAEEAVTGVRASDEANAAARASQASPGQAALDRMLQTAPGAAESAVTGPAPADAAMTAPGQANVAGYRTMSQVPDIRGMHVNDAVKAVQGNPHLIAQPSGGFIGAPRDVKSFDDLQALRARFDARLEENLGGADWYDRYRAGQAQATGNDPTKNLWQSQMHGTWSQGVNPESETQFAIKEGTGAIAGQPTKAMYANQHDAFMRAIAAGDPSLAQTGMKTGQYAQHINPDYLSLNPPGATGVNDFRYANEWGFVPEEGAGLRDGEVTLNPAQHRFLDYETALAADRANKHVNPDGTIGLGGRSDWTGEQIQATPWVSQKAAALMRDRPSLSAADAFTEANRTSPDFFDKHAANVATEMQPAPLGVIPGHAPNADQMTPQQRIDYANAVRWGSGPGGRDVIGEGALPGTGVGVQTLPTEQGTGLWQGQNNPMEIGRPLVAFDSSTSLGGDVSKTISDAQKAKTSQPSPPYALFHGDRVIPLGAEPSGKDITAKIAAGAPYDPKQPMTLTGNLKDLGTWEGFDPSGTSTIEGVPAGNKVTTQAGQDILDADAATKAYFGAQQGVGWHKAWPKPTLQGTNAYFVPMDRPATAEEMTRLGTAGTPYGMGDVTSTHGGLMATSFDPDKPPPTLTSGASGTQRKLESDIAQAAPQGTGLASPVRLDSNLKMPAWGQEGAGTATDWLMQQIGGSDQLRSFMNANPGYGRVAGQMAQRDAPSAFGPVIGGQRNDIYNARTVAAADPEYQGQGWADRLQKYQDILKSGGTLPKAIAVGGLATPLFSTAGFPAPVPQPQPQQGTTLNSVPPWAQGLQDQRFYGF